MLKKISHISLFIMGLSIPLPLFALALGPIDTRQASLFSRFSGNIPIEGANANLISSHTIIRIIAAKEYVDNSMQESVKQLNARLVQNEQGQPNIKIFSNQPINDSILEFSLDFTWEGGRTSRNYVVLLDPPRKSAKVSTANQVIENRQRHSTASSTVKVKVADSSFSQSFKTEKFRTDEQGKIIYGPTDRTDTLSKIAKRIRPENASSAQVMYVLFKENPRSFSGNNINRLKAGYTLTIENPDAMMAISTQGAKRFLFPERYTSTPTMTDMSSPSSTETPETVASTTDEQRQIERKWLEFSQLKDEVTDAMSKQQANEQENDRVKQKIASLEALLPELSAQLEEKNALLEQTKKQTSKSTL